MADTTTAIEWDGAALDAAARRVKDDGIIEAKGVRLGAEQLTALLKEAPRSKDTDRPILNRADFSGATFSEEAEFAVVTFSGRVSFYGATFSRDASFNGATFGSDVQFNGARFEGDASFIEAAFSGDGWFDDATFSKDASFYEARFSQHASFTVATFSADTSFHKARFNRTASFHKTTFSGDATFDEATFGHVAFFAATFSEDASFGETTFSNDASFGRTTFSGEASFRKARFDGHAGFGQATFRRDARFDGTTFERSGLLGSMHVFERLWLDGAVFAERVIVEASARRASFARADFRGGSAIRLRWADVWLADTEFAGPSVLEGLQPQFEPGGSRGFLGWEKPEADGTWTTSLPTAPEDFAPCLLSLRDARVAQLALAGVDLRWCQFASAHGLDVLNYERAHFSEPPPGWRWIRWRPVRWTRRRTIAEEHLWRATREQKYGPGWILRQALDRRGPAARRASWPPETPAAPGGQEIADIYRELRKGREDKKDEPGAADFYYGEMEMRRHSAHLAERTILWLYWMVSGYGLRASRALLALAVTIVLGALLLQQFGFDAGKQPDDGTLLFAIESSISLFRAPEGPLTPEGHTIQIVLRLAGPLFFGLALLALRGRVKR